MGLAIGIADYTLLRRGLKNIFMAMLGSVVASAIYFLISPQYEGSSQLLARTSPSIYDVFVALFGGAAGILGIACKNKGQVMPGVAIATSLCPSLYGRLWPCHGLAALFHGGIVSLFHQHHLYSLCDVDWSEKSTGHCLLHCLHNDRRKLLSDVWAMIRKSLFINEATAFVEKEMVFPNTQVLNHKEYIQNGKKYIDVTLIGAARRRIHCSWLCSNKLDSVGLGERGAEYKAGLMSERKVDKDKDFGILF